MNQQDNENLVDLIDEDQLPISPDYYPDIEKKACMVGDDLFIGYAVRDHDVRCIEDEMGEEGKLSRKGSMEVALADASIYIDDWLESNPIPALLEANQEAKERFLEQALRIPSVLEWVQNSAYPGALQDPEYPRHRLRRWLKTAAQNPVAEEFELTRLVDLFEDMARENFLAPAIAARAVGNPYAVIGQITGQNDHFKIIEDSLKAEIDPDASGNHYVVWTPHHESHERDIDVLGKTLSVGEIVKSTLTLVNGEWSRKPVYQAHLDPELEGEESPNFDTMEGACNWLEGNASIPENPSLKGRRRAAIWHAKWYSQTYNQIADGEVYIAVVAQYRKDSTGEWQLVDHDTCGGAIGAKWANEVVEEMMPSAAVDSEPVLRAA